MVVQKVRNSKENLTNGSRDSWPIFPVCFFSRSSCRLGGSLQAGHLVILVIVTLGLRYCNYSNTIIMPVKSSESEDVDNSFWNHLNIDVGDLYATTSECLLSEDIWNKFELLSDLAFDLDDFGDFETQSDNYYAALNCEIRNHDCMWAGHCVSKKHPNLETCKVPKPTAEVSTAGPRVVKQTFIPAGRSVLLKPPLVKAPVASPDSPPMSDDEEAKVKPTKMLQFLHDAISECDTIDEDSDLCEYFEEGEGEDIVTDPGDEDEKPKRPPPRFAGENDHCYYMERGSYGRVDSLGIDTPSDSGEWNRFDFCGGVVSGERVGAFALSMGRLPFFI